MLQALMDNRLQTFAVIIFSIGFMLLLMHKNLIKKIIGMNFMDSALYLFLASCGYIDGRKAPIITDGVVSETAYINPIPSGLVLTGIVVSVSVTAVMLSLTIRIYRQYRTLNVDEIYMRAREEMK